ncbi:hypothetical protein ACFWA5_45345 [Streptomyces mirabilis]|uniref:hypothetical protein n=1 Tax=Streptomyces mirabilis TaxID=68239 RepID=UPI0036590308
MRVWHRGRHIGSERAAGILLRPAALYEFVLRRVVLLRLWFLGQWLRTIRRLDLRVARHSGGLGRR